MSRIAERIARNATYSAASNLVAFVAGAVSSVVLARLLGPSDLGTFALVLSTGGLLAMAVALGIPHAANKYVAEYEARGDRDTARRVLAWFARFEAGMALLIGSAAFLAAPWLERAFDAPHFAPAFRIVAAGLLPGAIAGLALAGLQGLQDYRPVSLISIASTAFLFATTVGLLAAGAGVIGAAGAFAATAIVSALLSVPALGRHLALSLRRASVPRDARAKLRRYVPAVSVVLALDAIVWQRSEIFFLGIFRSAREVAWYALAFGVSATVMRLLPRALSFVLAPVASGLYGAGDRAGMQTLFRTGSRYLCMMAAPVAAGGAALAHRFLTAVYGEDYAPAAAAFPLLLLAAGFGAMGSVTAAIQTGMERQGLVLKVAVAAAAVNLSLDVALIPAWGVTGAAIANAAAQVGAVVAGAVLTARIVGARFPLADCARTVLAAGLVAGVASVIVATTGGAVGLAAGVVSGAALYPAALLATGALRADDLELLRAAEPALPRRLRPGYRALLRLAERALLSARPDRGARGAGLDPRAAEVSPAAPGYADAGGSPR